MSQTTATKNQLSERSLVKCLMPIASAALALGFALPSRAFTLIYSGNTKGGPTFNRPQTAGFEIAPTDPIALSTIGTRVPYFVQPFIVDTTDSYDVFGSQNFDGIQYLYQNSFDPNNPLVNLLDGNDPFPDRGNSGFLGLSLTAGQQYVLVTTGFDDTNRSFGTFRNAITNVPIPDSSSMGVGSAVVFGIGCLILKRKQKH